MSQQPLSVVDEATLCIAASAMEIQAAWAIFGGQNSTALLCPCSCRQLLGCTVSQVLGAGGLAQDIKTSKTRPKGVRTRRAGQMPGAHCSVNINLLMTRASARPLEKGGRGPWGKAAGDGCVSCAQATGCRFLASGGVHLDIASSDRWVTCFLFYFVFNRRAEGR